VLRRSLWNKGNEHMYLDNMSPRLNVNTRIEPVQLASKPKMFFSSPSPGKQVKVYKKITITPKM
jgi:hypothetical protein